jgi:hypothetical protein
MSENNDIRTAAVGGIHEGFNNSDTIKWPFVTYQLVSGPIARTWGSATLEALFDIVVRGLNPVEVNSLDTLITEELDGSSLSVTGLTTLIVRREEELPLPPERDAEGKKVYQNGATYSFWVDKNFDNPPP